MIGGYETSAQSFIQIAKSFVFSRKMDLGLDPVCLLSITVIEVRVVAYFKGGIHFAVVFIQSMRIKIKSQQIWPVFFCFFFLFIIIVQSLMMAFSSMTLKMEQKTPMWLWKNCGMSLHSASYRRLVNELAKHIHTYIHTPVNGISHLSCLYAYLGYDSDRRKRGWEAEWGNVRGMAFQQRLQTAPWWPARTELGW